MVKCRGYCVDYKWHGKLGYAFGMKRCSTCDIYISYEGNRCPCCKLILKTHPVDKSWRLKKKMAAEARAGMVVDIA